MRHSPSDQNAGQRGLPRRNSRRATTFQCRVKVSFTAFTWCGEMVALASIVLMVGEGKEKITTQNRPTKPTEG